MQEPILLTGKYLAKDVGAISFVNDFTFKDVIRFYMVHLQEPKVPREWHGHQQEFKYVTVVAGKALITAVPIDDWQNPSKVTKVFSYEISVDKPAVLYIPPGYANSSMALSDQCSIMYFSNRTVAQSQADDFRWPADYWGIL